MTKNSTPSEILAEIMQQSLTKNPELAAKQARLLQMLSNDTNSPRPADSTESRQGVSEGDDQ